jgi:hypothetical protein
MLKHLFLFLLLAGPVAGQTIADPGFEVPVQGQGKFTYRPTGSAWAFTGNSALAGNGSGFTSANPPAPEGAQVAVLQQAAQVSQTVTGWPAGSYQVSFQAAQRNFPAGGSQQVIEIRVDGRTISTVQPTGTAYQVYITAAFTVPAGDHTLAFVGTTPKEDSAFIDAVSIGAPRPGNSVLADPSFEAPQLGFGKYAGHPASSSWTYTGGTGISANGSGYTANNPVAPAGNQVAFLQALGSISQTVTFPAAGSLVLTFQSAQRNYPQPFGRQTVSVSIDGQVAANIVPAGTTYQTYYAMLPPVAAGDHVIAISGLSGSPNDTAFVDAISIVSSLTTPVTVQDAWVGSSGKTIGFRFAGTPVATVTPTQSITPPVIYRNGEALPPLGAPADLAGNEVLLFPLPPGTAISTGDTVTATTPPIWQNTTGGLVAPFTGLAVDNRISRSPLPPSALAQRTFVPGVNNNTWPSGPWGNYWPFKNWAYKINWPPGDMQKIRGVGTSRVYSNAGYNGVDATSYPGPAGLWLVYWRSTTGSKGEPPAVFALTTVDAASTTVTERADLANPSAPGGYQARVFDFEHSPTSPTANIDVALQFNDPSNTGNYSDLWIVGPGDFDCTANTPVTFDTSDQFALSRTYTQWIPQGVGSLRWVDSSNCGGSPRSCPYPELLMKKSDSGWGELGARALQYGFTSLGPVDTTATPWMYSPFYRKDSERFTATLADPITTTPAVGTNETYSFSDAATAPLMTGLEITIDSEVMRIISVSGNSVKLYRGSNGTTPATHAAGVVSVSGRRPIGIPASGIIANGYTYQLTTSVPHGQFTGSISLATVGTGWPAVTWTDGSTTGRLDPRLPLVTGPNTLVTWIGPSAKPTGAKPIQTYPLDPTKCFSLTRYGSYIPPEVTAIATGKFPKASLHVNINMDACDDFVWHYMRLIRDNFPAGRSVIVEYLNEPWNFAFTGFEYCMKCADYLGYENPYSLSYYMRRSGEIGNIARAVFKETGRDGEIKLMLNCQIGSDQPKNHLTYAAKNGWQVDRIGNAPYLSIDTGQNAFATWDDDQLCDLWPMFLWYDTRPASYNTYAARARGYISDYNKTVGGDGCQLMGYEGGIEMAAPTGSANQVTRGMDLVYNPNWYWMEDTWYRWLQRQGFVNLHVYSLSQYHSPRLWGLYHWPRQKPGYGDGRFGGTDNRLRLASPGQPNSKPSNVNIDYNNSVRGQAFIDWIRSVP